MFRGTVENAFRRFETPTLNTRQELIENIQRSVRFTSEILGLNSDFSCIFTTLVDQIGSGDFSSFNWYFYYGIKLPLFPQNSDLYNADVNS